MNKCNHSVEGAVTSRLSLEKSQHSLLEKDKENSLIASFISFQGPVSHKSNAVLVLKSQVAFTLPFKVSLANQ